MFNKLILVITFLFVSSFSNATLISGQRILSNGKSVALQGLGWLPLTYTSGMSRTDIEDGFTDHFGNTWDSSYWRYATRAETETCDNTDL